MNKSSIFCTIMGIVGFFMGVAYLCTLIFIPIAIYCFLGAKMYMDASNLTDSQLTTKKQALLGYAIFFSIFAFPVGLLSIIPAKRATSNDVTITTTTSETTASKEEPASETPQVEVEKRESENTTSAEETLEKLQHLYDEGLITKEEYERAKSEIK